MVQREYENGVLDGRDEYSTLDWVADIVVTSGNISQLSGDFSRNACIVQNKEMNDNDTEYEAYYLYDQDTLYIVDGDNINDVSRELQQLIKDIQNGSYRANESKYVLSVKAK